MRQSLFISLFLSTALVFACSDDTTQPPQPDQKVADQGPKPDTGPTPEAGNPDVGTPDGPVAKKKVEEYVPKDNDVAGWTEDTTSPGTKPGIESGYTDKDIEDIINGHHAPYATAGTVGFAKQEYQKAKGLIALEIWEMKDTAAAQSMFTKNKTDGEKDNGWTFENITGVADQSIVVNAYDAGWTAFTQKGPYIYQVIAVTTEAGGEAALKTELETFIKFLSGNLP